MREPRSSLPQHRRARRDREAKFMSVRDQIFTSAIAISAALACTPAAAQTEQRRGYQLEAQDLGTALRAVGRTSNSKIFFEHNILAQKRAPALRGPSTPAQTTDPLTKQQ